MTDLQFWAAFGLLQGAWLAWNFFVAFPRAVRADLDRERAAWNRMADVALEAGNYPAATVCREIARRGPRR